MSLSTLQVSRLIVVASLTHCSATLECSWAERGSLCSLAVPIVLPQWKACVPALETDQMTCNSQRCRTFWPSVAVAKRVIRRALFTPPSCAFCLRLPRCDTGSPV